MPSLKRKKVGTQKAQQRKRRSGRAVAVVGRGTLPRVDVKKSINHITATLRSPKGDKTIASVSTQDKSFSSDFVRGVARTVTAIQIGEQLAKKAIQLGVKKVAFNRSGYKYHGVVKALADSAREHGLEF